MERLLARDLVSLPGLLSLVRAPLAAAFPFAMGEPLAALAVLAAAGLSDVLDGWVARRSGRASFTGAILDPVMDKLFVATVAVSMIITGHLSFGAVVLLGARDLLELPLVAWLALDPKVLRDRTGRVRANALGKAVTVVQFATVLAALVATQWVEGLVLASAALGVFAAATYWARAVRPR
jgi:CDP-diacylglycerol--glycerol-3-phosphate 3-phosphatidyltransferase/cardiolipin synthase